MMDDEWEQELEDAEWDAMCRANDVPSPKLTVEQRKTLLLRRRAAQIAELDAMVANAIADPKLPDPRKWRF